MTNLLLNPDLVYVAEDDPHRTWCWTTSDPNQEFYTTNLRHQLTRPEHWEIWFEHAEEFRPPWDLANEAGWIVPEVKLTEGSVDNKIYPERWCGDARGIAFFNTNATSRGGIYQQAATTPGNKYTLGGWSHAWSSDDHDPLYSDGVGYGPFAMSWADIDAEFADDQKHRDMLQSVSFKIGIDPTGGVSPFSPNVVWSEPYAVYNEYSELPGVTVTAESDKITVFSWCDNRWRNHHNDRYMTKFSLEEIGEASPPGPPEDVDYDYPVIKTGSKWHPHGVGEAGSYDILMRMSEEGSPLPYCKIVAPYAKDMLAVRNLKALSPTTKFIVRLMHGTDPNINIEGPDFNSSASAYMESLKPIIDEYKDVVEYWELWNEQDPPSHIPMAEFAVECMYIANSWGIKLALMSYSTGVPEI